MSCPDLNALIVLKSFKKTISFIRWSLGLSLQKTPSGKSKISSSGEIQIEA